MARFVFNTLSETMQTLTNNETGVITQNGSLVTSGPAITVSGYNATVTNAGTLAADLYAIFADAGGSGLSLNNSGQISGGSTSGAICIASTGLARVKIVNSGRIWGTEEGSDGILILSGGNAINNSGEIVGMHDEALEFAADTNPGGETNRIVNTGIIARVGTGMAIQFSVVMDTLINSGQVFGNVALSGGADIYDGRGGSVEGTVSGGNGDDFLRGGAFDDLFNGDNDNDTMRGGDGSDTLDGDLGADIVNGNAGDDDLRDSSGNDTLRGELGDDRLEAGADDDLLVGGQGDDTMQSGSGNDSLTGGLGDDQMAGDTGNDTLYGNAGDDSLMGGDDNDQLYGGDGRDTLGGGTGNDLLNGGDGNDLLSGSSGIDTLVGGTGEDRILGGSSGDRLSGGADADTFEYATAGDSSAANYDTITDFSTSGGDLIDLSETSAQVMAFVGTAAFSGGGVASVRVVNVSSTQRQVLVDSDGNGSVNMRIDFDGALTFTAGDFIL